jgi:hypothetical protein
MVRPRLRVVIGCVALAWLCVASAQAQTTSHQGIWWASPAGSESGWGINFTHQGDVIFATWFTYDTQGRPLWLVATMHQQAGTATFSGDLMQTTGPAFSATPFDPAKITKSKVGTMSVTFQDPASATLTYSIGLIAQTKAITPQAFRSLPSCQLSSVAILASATNYQGLWWAAPAGSESGWGINFAHQEDVIFATWFTYGDDGEPLWIVATLARQPDGSFAGDLVRTSGPAFNSVPFNPALVQKAKAGTAALRFTSGNSGTFTYSVSGVTQTKNITPQVFRDQVTACERSTLYSVPTDITKVAYPDSYITPLSERLDPHPDVCDLDLSAVSYPQSWIGQFPLPKVIGAPLKASYLRGMDLKDIMLSNNPAFILPGAPDAPNGCTGSLRSEFVKTVSRLKSLGVDYIAPPQWHWLSKRNDGTWYVVRAEDSFGPLGDSDLAFLVQTAHAAGIKVLMKNAAQGMQDIPNAPAYVPEMTFSNVQNWFAAYQPFMVERAKFFQSIGIDAWELDCGACWITGLAPGAATREETDYIVQQYVQTLANIKPLYSGKLMVGYSWWLDSAPSVLDQIDIISFGFFGPMQPIAADRASNLNVESMKNLLNWPGLYIENNVDKLNKTLLFEYSIQSRANAHTMPGYMEESACSPFGSLNPSTNGACIERETQPDFSLQAIMSEAMLELIGELNLKSNVMVLPSNYWETDPLKPETAFPNIAASTRNKPAEGILKAWYAR